MARMTRLRTSPDTLLAPGEGFKKVLLPRQLKQKRQAAEIAALPPGDEVKRLKLAEQHLRENRK